MNAMPMTIWVVDVMSMNILVEGCDLRETYRSLDAIPENMWDFRRHIKTWVVRYDIKEHLGCYT